MFEVGFTSFDVFFFLSRSPTFSFCTVFGAISPNKEKLLSINLSMYVFVSGDGNTIVRNRVTYSW